MKHIIAILAVFTLASAPVLAQSNAGAVAGANAGSTSSAGSASGASSGAAVYQTYNNSGTTTSTLNGTRTLRAAPDVIAPSLGSGHPCMINTSVGFSVIGGGASGGSGKVDVGCMMMRSNNGVDNMAGRYYYAAKDKTACQAWKRVGAIPKDYPCTKAEQKVQREAQATPVVASRSAPPRQQARSAGYEKCVMGPNNKITIKYRYGADKTAARVACLAHLGY